MVHQKVQVQSKIPMNSEVLRELLEEAGFEVEGIIEAPPGEIFNAVDLVSFVVEHFDDAVIGVIVGVVANWISGDSVKRILGKRQVRFSIRDVKHIENLTIINVLGNGNWVQVHPRPEQPDEDQ